MPTREQYAWAAGFWEGEGCITPRPHRPGDDLVTPYLSASQVTREPLDRLVEIFGGKVYGPYSRGRHQPAYMWNIAGWGPVAEAVKAMREWLSVRRCEQIDAVFAQYNPLRNVGKGGRNRAKPHCPHGHAYTAENTYHMKTPHGRGRGCKRCRRERKRVSR